MGSLPILRFCFFIFILLLLCLLLIFVSFHIEALEKNQQWLVYDQQREVYVKGLLAKIYELEQKSETAAHSLPQPTKKTESEGTGIICSFGIGLPGIFPKERFLKFRFL